MEFLGVRNAKSVSCRPIPTSVLSRLKTSQHSLKSAWRSTRFISENEGLSRRYNQRGVLPRDEAILARLSSLPIRINNFAICFFPQLFCFLTKEMSRYYARASIIRERIVCKRVWVYFTIIFAFPGR